jgi:hypothetical protein
MAAEITQTRTMTGKEVTKALKYCIATKRPVFLWGPMGIGKSSLVAKLCKDMGGKMYDMRLSQVEQTDLRGMPYFNKVSNMMEWAAPIDLPSQEEASQYPITFLFLDEMNAAAPAVQAAAYQLCLDRKVGTYKLPDNCVIIAAGNRESDKGVTYRQPAPLANRFIHFEQRVDFDSWNEWALDNQINADVVGFLNFSKNSLFDFDPKSPSKAFATPRSWEFVSQVISEDMDEHTASNIIAGTIGEGLMLKFMAHRKHASKLPAIKDIISGKVTELKTKEISAMYSLATSLAYELKDMWGQLAKTKNEKNWHEAADNVLAFMMNGFTTEITVMSMRAMLQQYNLPFSPSKMTNFKQFHEKFGKLILKASSV